jgi:NADPH:quinone reductase-like Zn-dependent oxidoreductase
VLRQEHQYLRHASARRVDQDDVLRFAQQGLIDPIISHAFLLLKVVAAHRTLKGVQHIGKIVLIP